MRLSDDYKNELSRLTLSDDFKQKLKERCIAEAKLGESENTSDTAAEAVKNSETYKQIQRIRLYRYVAIAACLVAAISIVGGASMMGSVFKTASSDSSSQVNSSDDVGRYGSSTDLMYDTESEYDDVIAEEESIMPMDVGDIIYEYDDDDDLTVETPEAISVEDAIISEGDESDEMFVEQSDGVTTSATSSSSVTPDDYTGDYDTENYVLGGSGSGSMSSASVYQSFANLSTAIGDSYTAEYSNASNFYDVLYNQLGDESDTIGVSLVWITITGTPSSDGVPAPSGSGYTLYSANISYDYLGTVSCDIDVYVWIKGTKDYQVSGMPVYKKGDELIVSLRLGSNGCITVVDELIYDAYTLGGKDIVYHRVYSNVNPGSTNMGVLDIEKEYYTTTSNNPALYVHKASASELTRYIRRKVSGEGYRIADLEAISLYSMGSADYTIFLELLEQEVATSEEDGDSDEQTESDNSEKRETLSISAGSSSSYMSITAAGNAISLGDDGSTAALLGDLYRNSMTGYSIGDDGAATVLFVGGKIVFTTSEPFEGGISEIEITSSGCPLDIEFRGITIGDSLSDVKEKLSTQTASVKSTNLADNCVITVKSDYGTVVITVEEGTVSKLSFKS